MTGGNQVDDPRRIQRARVHAEMKRNNVVTNLRILTPGEELVRPVIKLVLLPTEEDPFT